MSPASKKRRRRPLRRPAAETPPPAAVSKPVAATGPARPRPQIEDRRPQAPWGSFPLVEIVVLVALVMLVAGFFVSGPRGATLLVSGFALGSLAGLELSLREHLGGYRSHTVLLSAAAGVLSMILLGYVGGLAVAVAAIGGAAVFGLCAWLLARAFRKRAGRLVKLR